MPIGHDSLILGEWECQRVTTKVRHNSALYARATKKAIILGFLDDLPVTVTIKHSEDIKNGEGKNGKVLIERRRFNRLSSTWPLECGCQKAAGATYAYVSKP